MDGFTSLGGSAEVESASIDVGLGHAFNVSEEDHHLVDVVSPVEIRVVDSDERGDGLDENTFVGLHFEDPSVSTEDLLAGSGDSVEVVSWRAGSDEALLGGRVEGVSIWADSSFALGGGSVESPSFRAADSVALVGLGVELESFRA